MYAITKDSQLTSIELTGQHGSILYRYRDELSDEIVARVHTFIKFQKDDFTRVSIIEANADNIAASLRKAKALLPK